MKWLALLLALLVPPAQAATQAFTGQGQSVVIGEDVSAATTIARDAARAAALGAALDYFVERGSVQRHDYNVKKGALLAGDASFVASETVLSQVRDGPLLRLSLELVVDLAAMERQLGLQGLNTAQQRQARALEKPVAMVLVAEELNGSLNSFPYSTQVIQQRLRGADYHLVDETAAARAQKHDQAVQAMLNADLGTARALALQYDAGLLITGRAIAQKSGIQGGGMQSYGANVALSAIAADSGRVLASATADGTYPHVNAVTGSRLAVEEAAAAAIAELLSALENEESYLGRALRFTISGVNYQQLAILKKLLQRDFNQVISIDTRGFTGDVARLDVELAGSVVDFAEALALKDFGGFRIQVLSQSSEKIDAALVKG